MTNYNERLDEIFKTSPIDKEIPEDIRGTIYATWTGLWTGISTDGYGEWDEKQPSDIYPLDELLSTQARDRLKQDITSLIKELVAEARIEELTSLLSMQNNKPRRVLLKDAVNIAYSRVCELSDAKKLHEETTNDQL